MRKRDHSPKVPSNNRAGDGPRRDMRPRIKGAGPTAEGGYSAPRGVIEEIRAKARPPQAERAVGAFERAVQLLERGRDAPAASAAAEAKAAAPRSAAVREVLGLALYRSGRFREALQELQAYRRMSGRHDQNHLIADSYRAIGAPEKAVEPAKEALRAKVPEEVRAEAAVVGAAALADLRRFPEALALIRSFRGSPKTARPFDLRVWYVTGDILERAGRRREALEEFRRIVRHDPAVFDAAERVARLEA